MLLEGRTAIVTGGGRGIGRAIARKLAGEGAAVVVASRSSKEIDAVAAEIQKAGGRAKAVAADVAKLAECEEIVRVAREVFGKVDILVNNAGILGPVAPAEKTTPEQWNEVLATNLTSAFLMSRLVIPEMYERQSGAILNLSSVAGKVAFPMNSAYAATKAGLLGLTRTLAAEGARKGVRVNGIAPGPVNDTNMWQDLAGQLGPMSQHVADQILQGRLQTTEEIAAAALFLVSDQASAITGQTLNVDGGMAFY
ncbi:MAG TPA: SDR family NAD(P)-dependent oxidoreductase [Candidatus Aquilonibacter sp.]|nr:SDR family NAD(P)-dependent oxidoreductase [Candidatus Aquilonibacter sp.]